MSGEFLAANSPKKIMKTKMKPNFWSNSIENLTILDLEILNLPRQFGQYFVIMSKRHSRQKNGMFITIFIMILMRSENELMKNKSMIFHIYLLNYEKFNKSMIC